MTDPRAEQITQLKQSIASLEDMQRAMQVDLSASLQPLRDLLVTLETATPAPAVNTVSGGIDLDADHVTISGDAVGRDKITSTTETITATDGSIALKDSDVRGDILINSTKIIYSGDDPAANQALLARYLKWVMRDCAPLKLTGIDQGAAKPGQQPLGLTSVYVDLNIGWVAAKGYTYADQGMVPLGIDYETRLVTVLEVLSFYPRMALLGKPGSGKSTLCTYLALSLAEAGLGDDSALKRLSPDWTYGPLLPVRVVLRQFAASLPADAPHGEASHVWQFIRSEIIRHGLPDKTGDLVQDVVAKSGALFLLDGLDEVGDEQRRAIVLEAVSKFMHTAGDQCRFLITARPYAWEDSEHRLANVQRAYQLADFELDQIDLFIARWYDAIVVLGWINEQTAREKSQELQTAVRRSDLLALASNPLLLTLMVTLHSNRTRLPDDRADLYNEVVDLLLERWNKSSGADSGLIDALAIPTLTLSNLREPIEQLAFDAHAEHRGKPGTADLAEMALLGAFRPLLGGKLDKASLVIDYIEKRAGLFIGQGVRQHQRQFTFPHRTFQEYLAACYLASQNDFSERSYDLAQDAPLHWREVIILAARTAGKERGFAAANTLIHGQSCDEYRRKGNMPRETDWQAAILAGAQLLEIGLAVVESRDVYRALRDRVTNWLLRLIETPRLLPLNERIESGNILGRLGDPRLTLKQSSTGLKYLFPPSAKVAAGPFMMGSSNSEPDSYEDEYSIATDKERHVVFVPEFSFGVYPVTNVEYSWFVYSTNAIAPSHWRNGEVPSGQESHPVVNVSWYDSLAYCQWLSQVSGLHVRLPTEVEWEKAARWDEDAQHSNIYPWGDEWDVRRCNTSEAELHGTSPVGIYPNGSSPNGALDIVGNVYEWTQSKFASYPYDADDGRESLLGSESRILRGGAWDRSQGYCRCASRFILHPGIRSNNIGFRLAFS